MTSFKGFETKEAAKAFIKEHGGLLTTCVPTKSGRKPSSYSDYMLAVHLGGLDQEKYPYCVQWNERSNRT